MKEKKGHNYTSPDLSTLQEVVIENHAAPSVGSTFRDAQSSAAFNDRETSDMGYHVALFKSDRY